MNTISCANCPFGKDGTVGVMCKHPKVTAYWNIKRYHGDDGSDQPRQWNAENYLCRYHPVLETILIEQQLIEGEQP